MDSTSVHEDRHGDGRYGAVFDPHQMLAVLDRHRVEYIVVGGYAAQLHGASRPTIDLDVTPATTPENLQRLAAALRELGGTHPRRGGPGRAAVVGDG